MKTLISSFFSRILTFAVLLISFQANSQPTKNSNSTLDWPIIKSKGDQLYEGDKLFRFFGLAAPNIQANENQLRKDLTNRFPDEFEIRDILGGLQRVGGRATRTFSLSVYSPLDVNVPFHISAKRTYNEDAFRCLDLILSLCKEYDVRLIIPFIASQSFGNVRGVDEFSALSGKPKHSFWTDESVKADFKHFLTFLLNRKNTITGTLYKDDPAILAWQLGNEFGSFAGDRGLDYNEWSPKILKWSLEMAAFIKSIDKNHLIMEAGGADREAYIKDKNIDLISDHLYEYWNKMGGKPYDLSLIAKESMAQCRGKKPLVIDEFGLGSVENLSNLMKTIREEGIVGGLLWSIRSHRRDGGWYYHNEGGTQVNSYHVPGFAAGYHYDEKLMLDLLKKEAYLIRDLPVPALQKPTPAPVLMIKNEGFTWRGSTGASFYIIEKSESKNGPWKVLETGLEDSIIFDVKNFEGTPEAAEPLVFYTDVNTVKGQTYFYRIKGVNSAGESEYSQVLEVLK